MVPVILDAVVKSKDYVYEQIDGCATAGLSIWQRSIIRVMGAWPFFSSFDYGKLKERA